MQFTAYMLNDEYTKNKINQQILNNNLKINEQVYAYATNDLKMNEEEIYFIYAEGKGCPIAQEAAQYIMLFDNSYCVIEAFNMSSVCGNDELCCHIKNIQNTSSLSNSELKNHIKNAFLAYYKLLAGDNKFSLTFAEHL